MLLKCCTQYGRKFGNLSSGHRTGKSQFSFQTQGKAVPKNAQNSPSQMFKLVLEKAEEPEIKLPTSVGTSKKEQSSRNTSISALLTMPKPLTVWITKNCGKFFKRWEYLTT